MSELTEFNTVPEEAPEFPRRPLLLFFPAAVLYHEWLLQLFDRSSPFFSAALAPVTVFALSAGLAAALAVDLLPHRSLRMAAACVLTVLWTVFTCVEYCCKSYFRTYFSLGYAWSMTGNVMGNFASTMAEVILGRLPFILLSFLPLAVLLLFHEKILPRVSVGRPMRLGLLAGALLLQLCGVIMGVFGPYRALYTYDFNADRSIPQFGLVSQSQLELVYGIFGMPPAPLTDISVILDTEPAPATPTQLPEAVVYAENVLDIDFAALAESEKNNTLRSMHRYFAAKPATKQNRCTGLFAGKNLIVITAEAFSPYVVSPELTPTLHRLSHEGFVFTDYYQPGWGQSTTGGEFSVLTGLLPTWVNGNVSFYASYRNDMPLALGNQLRQLGYQTRAWHDNYYAYYDRNLTHPNLGYDYAGVGSGLVLTGGGEDAWPYSDLEMMEQTVDLYLQDYAESGTPFHVYYMTVSGHGNWGWGNSMSTRHRAEAEAAYPDASSTVQAYIAANLEVEAALRYLCDRLEEAGALEDTVICLTADHYPYAMVTETVDYYRELSGVQDTEEDISRYRNTLILWCGSMKEPVVVDTPCSAVDILPTLSNLFGLDYDSRLLSGRDVLDDSTPPETLSPSMPLVILPTSQGNSWRTAAGSYDAGKHTFTPRPGLTLPDTYADTVNEIVAAKYTYAKLVVQYNYYQLVCPQQENIG